MLPQASVLPHLWREGGAVPHLADGGGTPFPGPGGGGYPLPRSGLGGVPGPGRGYPLPSSRWGVPPSQVQAGGHPLLRPGKGVLPYSPTLGRGSPHLELGTGYPPPGIRKGVPPPLQTWNSIACTCYTAGGMPLAFTQEDFLVYLFIYYHLLTWHDGRLCFHKSLSVNTSNIRR